MAMATAFLWLTFVVSLLLCIDNVFGGLYVSPPINGYSKQCNPMDYGAKGDGKTDDTSSIQKAMDDCYADDNSEVYFPSKHSFLSFPLQLKYKKTSNVGFTIRDGATLMISNDRSKWPSGVDFINIQYMNDMVISGPGTINGQGQVWWAHQGSFAPRTIYAKDGSNYLIKDLTIINPPYHTLELYVDATELDNVTILAPPSTGVPSDQQSHNTDAVDIHGEPFYIHDCYFSVGDDNIAAHSNDSLIQNCQFGTGHGASIGSIDGGWYKNITFDHITFKNTTNGARIKVDAGSKKGKIWDITYSNLNMDNVQYPIIVSEYYSSNKEEKTEMDIDGVVFESITATNTISQAGQFECQSSSPCQKITLKNIKITGNSKMKPFECKDCHGTATDVEPSSCLES